MRPYDPARDRAERAEGRLHRELLEVLTRAGAAYDATYILVPEEPELPATADEPAAPAPPAVTGDLDDLVFDIGWDVRQALARDPHGQTSHDPQAGWDAVAVLVRLLGARLDELGGPNPLAGLDATALVDRAGGPEAWTQTVAHDRPLLITRRVARRALDPEVPTDIYRPWCS